MAKELVNRYEVDDLYNNIAQLIDDGKKSVVRAANDTMIALYWSIGKTINDDILCGDRAPYGDAIIGELSNRLSSSFGKGFNNLSATYI